MKTKKSVINIAKDYIYRNNATGSTAVQALKNLIVLTNFTIN
ncbi:hypothetical protein PPRY_a3446 [Pseudoalteromonas prydzensis ACAM 620]|nr:hypothetical protein [Pseudoalteromonas prydzensis ACAM 620]